MSGERFWSLWLGHTHIDNAFDSHLISGCFLATFCFFVFYACIGLGELLAWYLDVFFSWEERFLRLDAEGLGDYILIYH